MFVIPLPSYCYILISPHLPVSLSSFQLLLFLSFTIPLLLRQRTIMGTHHSDDNIYLLGRDEAETERYASLLKAILSRLH